MLNAYIYDGVRTPFGRHAGALASIRPDDLLAGVLKILVARNGFDPGSYEDVIAGCVCQSGEDSRNIARFSTLLAGLPVETGGLTVNRLCGSGLAAVLDAARCVSVGEAELYFAGGVESMTRAPFAIAKSDVPYQSNSAIFDTAIGTRFPNATFAERYGIESMPETADTVAREFKITRQQADQYAFNSQQRYRTAHQQGFFDREITPVEVPQGRRSPPRSISTDEHPRPDATLEKMQSLSPLFEGGVTTAANASGINDGAAALIVGSAEIGQRNGVRPRGRILAGAIAGVSPKIMGTGPAYAIPKALERAGLSLQQMDLIEINEAFAAQVLGCLKIMQISPEDSRLNPNGGAIAVGHPLGASGARLGLT
ncbi:MAG: acetyl-CoA C-acyltransferase, partial [bacterium]